MPNNAVTRLTHIDEARKCLQSLDKESEAARIINALIATIERLTRESKIDQERIATEQELKQQGIDVIRSLREQLQIVEQRASLAAGIALEQAAKVCDKEAERQSLSEAEVCANKIRSLITNPPEVEKVLLRTVLTFDASGRLVAVARQNAKGQIIESLWEAPTLNELSERFIRWPLPDSVCADLCATKQRYPRRTGTNLLTKTEAKEMLRHVLGDSAMSNRERK